MLKTVLLVSIIREKKLPLLAVMAHNWTFLQQKRKKKTTKESDKGHRRCATCPRTNSLSCIARMIEYASMTLFQLDDINTFMVSRARK